MYRDAAAGPLRVDAELARLVTYASIGYMYDHRAGVHPTDAQIAAAHPAINWCHMAVDQAASTIRFLRPGVRIDLGDYERFFDEGVR